ncbi:hypothetical protein [Solilutibacter silvestris]|uniref:hypothetical protein n=1 Tax=Solilutibacter silvestris TaxID=1645665 RepID=UPI003D327A72
MDSTDSPGPPQDDGECIERSFKTEIGEVQIFVSATNAMDRKTLDMLCKIGIRAALSGLLKDT